MLKSNSMAFGVNSSSIRLNWLGIVAKNLSFLKRCPTHTNLQDCTRLQSRDEANCLSSCIYYYATLHQILLMLSSLLSRGGLWSVCHPWSAHHPWICSGQGWDPLVSVQKTFNKMLCFCILEGTTSQSLIYEYGACCAMVWLLSHHISHKSMTH